MMTTHPNAVRATHKNLVHCILSLGGQININKAFTDHLAV